MTRRSAPRPRDEVGATARRLVHELRARARPIEGFDAVRYLSSPLPVLQVRAPDVQAIARAFAREAAGWPLPRIHSLLRRLWAGRSFEERILAIEIAIRFRRRLDDRSWQVFVRWLPSATGWGLSDSLAGGLLGRMVGGSEARYRELLGWTRSPDPWRRRPALYAIGPWVRRGELDRPFVVLGRLADDPEFWVQRAVGTWLRECMKRDPARTERFLRARAATLPPVALTVATERAPRALRVELRAMRARPRSGRTVARGRRAGGSRAVGPGREPPQRTKYWNS